MAHMKKKKINVMNSQGRKYELLLAQREGKKLCTCTP